MDEEGIFYYCYPPPEIESPPSHAADKDRLRSVHQDASREWARGVLYSSDDDGLVE